MSCEDERLMGLCLNVGFVVPVEAGVKKIGLEGLVLSWNIHRDSEKALLLSEDETFREERECRKHRRFRGCSIATSCTPSCRCWPIQQIKNKM